MATTPLLPDFKEFLSLLNENNVPYLLVGGYAVGFHGFVRSTLDFDVWVDACDASSLGVVKALAEFGFPVDDERPERFLARNPIVRIGAPPFRLEILTQIDGVRFDECYEAGVDETIDGTTIRFISLDHLKKNKRSSGRSKDLADLEELP